MTFIWITVTVGLTLILLDVVYRYFVAGRIRNLIEDVPFGIIDAAPPTATHTFRIPVDGDRTLAACLYPARGEPRGLILFCPELHGNRWTALNYCAALRDAGFSLLSFDFRNQGDSDADPGHVPIHWATESEVADISAVIDFVLADGALSRFPLGAFGVSRGGSIALLAACRYSQIQSVVTDSAYSTRSLVFHFTNRFSRYIVPEWFFKWLPVWHVRMDVEQALRRSERHRGQRYVHLECVARNLTQPVLLISGSRDSYVTPDVTQQLGELLRQPDSTWIVQKAKHNKSRSVSRDEYDSRIVNHFQRTLPATTKIPDIESSESRVA